VHGEFVLMQPLVFGINRGLHFKPRSEFSNFLLILVGIQAVDRETISFHS